MDLQEKSKTAKVSFPKIPTLQKISLRNISNEYSNYIALDFNESKAFATDGHIVLKEDFAFEGNNVGFILIPYQIFRKLGKEFTISQGEKINILTNKETFRFAAPPVFYPNVPRFINRIKGTEAVNIQLGSKSFKDFSLQAKKIEKNALNCTLFRFWLAKGTKKVVATADNDDYGFHYDTEFEQSVETSLNAQIILRGPMFVKFAKVAKGDFSYLPSDRLITINRDGLTAVFLAEPDYD